MLSKWFFPESIKREEEEYKQFMQSLTEYYKLCKIKKVIRHMEVKSFVLTNSLKNCINTNGSVFLLKVESSNIQGIGYRNNLLYVAFNSDIVYSYERVPKQIVLDFLKANSKGKYFNIFIRKPGFPYKKVGKL